MANVKQPLLAPHKQRTYQIVILLLSIGILSLSYQYWRLNQNLKFAKAPVEDLNPSSTNLPHYQEIMNIIRPLEYSGIQAMTRGDIKLSINFANGTWTLRNIHRYDAEGNIILDSYRYGLCGELASHTYNRIRPLLSEKFEISFAQVAESGFFLAPHATHVVLSIRDRSNENTYLLDPSFHRYGASDDFQEYLFFGYSDTVSGIKEKETDVSFRVDFGTPLLIRNNLISTFSVGTCDGKFDKDNYILAIKANRRYKYAGRYIYAIRKKDVHAEFFEDKWLESEALPAADIEKLKNIIMTWFKNLEIPSAK